MVEDRTFCRCRSRSDTNPVYRRPQSNLFGGLALAKIVGLVFFFSPSLLAIEGSTWVFVMFTAIAGEGWKRSWRLILKGELE